MHNSSFSESFRDICASKKLNPKPRSSKMALGKSSKLELVYSYVRVPMETNSLGDIGMLWASLTATVASLVLISWNISQKSWKKFASFVWMKVYLRHSCIWRWGLMVEASMITKLLMSFVLRKELSEKWLLLIPRIRMVLLSAVSKLLETWLGVFWNKVNCLTPFV